ncbi:MAG: C13 family peptidase [Candidatus Thorarchaeota archaeon]
MSKKSKTKKKSKRPTALILLVIILAGTNAATLAYFLVLDNSVPEGYVPEDHVPEGYVPFEDVPLSIANVTGEGNEDYIGQIISVVGYYVYTAGYHLLVANPLSVFNNSLGSRNHIVMTVSVPETMEDHRGFQICVKGILEIHDPSDGTSGITVDSFFDVTFEPATPGIYTDAIEEMLTKEDYPFWHEIDFEAEKYAVLYSGGIKPGKDHYRYWNDIIYMHFILEMRGYNPENIYVVYKDGVSEDGFTDVDYPANHTSMDTVFGILAAEMGRLDTLFFYTTNHGGGGGISVWGPMDNGGALTHSQVSGWLDSITCQNMIIIMEQCVSGKFITSSTDSLCGPNRIIMTACKDDESSYACDTEGSWDEFVYHFMCALVSYSFHDPGITVNADYWSDGQISMKEAFIYAAIHDSRAETPWYNDYYDGSTLAYSVGQVVFDLSGSPGEGVFL